MVVALTAILISASAAEIARSKSRSVRMLVRNLGRVKYTQPVFAEDLRRGQITLA